MIYDSIITFTNCAMHACMHRKPRTDSHYSKSRLGYFLAYQLHSNKSPFTRHCHLNLSPHPCPHPHGPINLLPLLAHTRHLPLRSFDDIFLIVRVRYALLCRNRIHPPAEIRQLGDKLGYISGKEGRISCQSVETKNEGRRESLFQQA